MSFTDQKPFIVTEDQVHQNWSGGKDGKHFRCGMCGHKFQAGDTCRWVYMNSTPDSHFGNFLVCAECDGPGIQARRIMWEREAGTRFWQLTRDAQRKDFDMPHEKRLIATMRKAKPFKTAITGVAYRIDLDNTVRDVWHIDDAGNYSKNALNAVGLPVNQPALYSVLESLKHVRDVDYSGHFGNSIFLTVAYPPHNAEPVLRRIEAVIRKHSKNCDSVVDAVERFRASKKDPT